MIRDEEGNRLRQIVLYSADVLPEKVSQYLKDLAEYGNWDAKKEVFKTYQPLVDHLPKVYVDFALDYLIEEPKEHQNPFPCYEEFHDFNRLGIRDDYECFPAAHVQGPFFYLLRKNEAEGLRLVHILTNTAVEKWRARETNPRFHNYSVTPLPVIINLASGPREFWGDNQVYYWYRPDGNCPSVVTSALMALEAWMEEQIEAGRDAEELFGRVLSDSESVATLGICLGIALAYPDKCLKAALPLMNSPAIWDMDVSRLVADSHGSFNFDPFGSYEIIYKLRANRDKRPQRACDIRHFAMRYALSKDDSLRIPFEQAIARFTEDLPFQYKEQQEDERAVADLRERMENFQVFGDRANYRAYQVEDGTQQIWVEPPEDIKARNEATLAPVRQYSEWTRAELWAHQTLDGKTVTADMSVEDAVTATRAFQKPNDFTTPCDVVRNHDGTRLRTIASVAAAVILKHFDWAEKHSYVTWCRDILLAAARMPYREDSMSDRQTQFKFDPKVSAGRGLAALVAHGAADSEVREQILHLIADRQLQVVDAVYSRLYHAWAVDEVLCQNALSLGLSLSLKHRAPRRPRGPFEPMPDEDEKEDEHPRRLVCTYLINLRQNTIPELPRVAIRDDIVFLWDIAERVLQSLPFEKLVENSKDKAQLLQLTDDLMAWTVQENTPPANNPRGDRANAPHEWNRFFLKWASDLARCLSLEETRRHVLAPIRESWSFAPQLTTELLEGCLYYHLGYLEPLTDEAQTGWREICNWVLDSSELAERANYDYLNREITDAVSLIVYVRYGKSYLKDEWSHAPLFSDITDKWVSVIGHNPHAYSYLITMLNGPGWTFAPEPALEWLSRIVKAHTDIGKLWCERDNGVRTAELLSRMWKNMDDQIRRDTASLKRYADLIDRLVATGVPLASRLQQQLEKRDL